MLSGVVLIHKPEGLSSQQVVTRVKRLLNIKKAGHTGSLDPMATGMLPVCLGRATKLCEYLLESDKFYRAELTLGTQTDSGDKQGKVIQTAPLPELSFSDLQLKIQQIFQEFLGPQTQIPPMVSALKHEGKCLYQLARAGIEIEREARPIEIYELKLVSLILDSQNIQMTFEVRCSKGTYIRVLGEDIAKKLGTLGHLTALHRISCAGFSEAEMRPLEFFQDLDATKVELIKTLIIPMESVLSYPKLEITAEILERLLQGKCVDLAYQNPWENPSDLSLSGRFQLCRDQKLVAIADLENGLVTHRKMVHEE
jgi:tRNA pseudouridine55 synthase